MRRQHVIVSGAFDDLRWRDVRYLEEAASEGPLRVALWTDELVLEQTGTRPKFPFAERRYLLESIRYVEEVIPISEAPAGNAMSPPAIDPRLLDEVPPPPECPREPRSARKKVVVTGCYDWFHSGHVRFFEEVSELGDLYVVVGHDQNIRLLKGEGHPLFPAAQRRYMVASVRFVKLALVSSGNGWMDAEPEFMRIRPDIYAVNEDGDRPEKRDFSRRHGIEYRVLRRLPKEGLPRRQSSELRGF